MSSRSIGRRSAALAALLAAVPQGVVEAQGPPEIGDTPPPAAPSRQSPATEGALFLLLPVGAQGVALGRAMTALPSQEGAFWNPAGLASVTQGRFLVYRGDHLAGDATAFSLLLARKPVGTLGISYQLLDIGDQDLRDGEGNVLGTVSVRNHLAVVSFATQVLERVHSGINFKVVQFRVSCRGQCLDAGIVATTYAVDAGLQAVPLERVPLRVGAMVAHLGPRLQVINAEQADPLPTRVRLSGAYEILGHFVAVPDLKLWFTVEAEDRWRTPGTPSLYMGTEFSAGRADMLFVRAGYVHGEVDQDDGAAVGFGLRYERFDVGIAKSLAGPSLSGESEPVHITFGVSF